MAIKDELGDSLLKSPAPAEAESRTVKLIFGTVGLSTAVLWNSLMLCVDVLVDFFGDSALASAATSQNILCALAMVTLTLTPCVRGTAMRVRLCLASIAMMVILGLGFATAIHNRSLPRSYFLMAVAVNGVSTGIAQNMAAALSADFPGAPGALLLGESCSPLVAVLISLAAGLFGLDPYSTAAAKLLLVEFFLVLALVALCRLRPIVPKPLPHCDTVGGCMKEGGTVKEYALRRLSELVGNCFVAFSSCMVWVSLLCSSPYMGSGLCGSDSACASALPKLMISAANFAAVSGRLVGLHRPHATQVSLLAEGSLLWIVGMWAIRAAVFGDLSALGANLASPLNLGLAVSIFLTFWSNFTLMCNDHSAQSSCGHSVILPCPVTTQIMWIAIQSGSIGGTLLATVW